MKNSFKALSLAAVASLALVGCGSSDGGSSDAPQVEYHPYDAPAISEADKAAYLNAVNAARAVARSCISPLTGEAINMPPVPPLSWSDGLYSSAYEHTEDMVTTGIRTHEGSGGSSDWTAQILELGRGSNFNERIVNNGVIAGATGENIAGGYSSSTAVVSGWLSSSTGHCVAIMSDTFTHLGMARIGNTWTQNFSQQ